MGQEPVGKTDSAGMAARDGSAGQEPPPALSGEAPGRDAEAGRRSDFISEASRVLASSLDYAMTLAAVARLAVPHIADWCAVDIVADDGRLERLAVEHVDPAKVKWARELYERRPPDPDAPSGVPHVIRTGQPEVYADISETWLAARLRDPESLRIAREVGMRSAMIVPLVARGQTLGAITFVTAESGRHYGSEDVALAEDLARRAATAVDNARLYGEAAQQREWLKVTLSSIGDAVIATDICGAVTFMNPVAESLTGWKEDEARGRELSEVFRVVNEQTREPAENPAARVLSEGQVMGLTNHTVLIGRDGAEIPIDDSAAPIRDATGKVVGVVLVFRAIVERRHAEQEMHRSRDQLSIILQGVADGITAQDPSGQIIFANEAAARILGYESLSDLLASPTAGIMQQFDLLDEEDRPFPPAKLPGRLALEGVTDAKATFRWRNRQTGEERWSSVQATPVLDDGGNVLFAINIFRDVTERMLGQRELAARARQQAAVAELGQHALAEPDLQALMDACVEIVAHTLGTEYCKVLELLPDGSALLLRAGAGWRPGLVGTATVGTGPDSQAGYTLTSSRPVVVEDLRTETRFSGPLLPTDQQIVSGMSVVIGDRQRPYGVLGTHTTRRRLFSADDVHFLQAVANILGSAIERNATEEALRRARDELEVRVRQRTAQLAGANEALLAEIVERRRIEEALRESEARFRRLAENAQDIIYRYRLSPALEWEYISPAVTALTGYTPEEYYMDPGLGRRVIYPDDRPLFEAVERSEQTPGAPVIARWICKSGKLIWTEHRVVPVLGAAGQVVAVEGIARDITDRVQAYQLLEQRVEERTRELSTLLRISQNVASTLELKPLLNLILDQLSTVLEFRSASILTIQGEDLALLEYRGPLRDEQVVDVRFPLAEGGVNQEVVRRAEPLIIADVRDDTPLAHAFLARAGPEAETVLGHIRSWMGVPLMIKDRVIGLISFHHTRPGYYTPAHASLALAIANQAAVAIENAKLYSQAHDLAVLEERQRLARELHDSVSQALYGIALGARTARNLVERDPGRVVEPLNYVLSLAEAGLAEMRALIFELRPESLETEGLVVALTKQADSLRARHKMSVEVDLPTEPNVPLDVKEALYRIAQEAMHNTVKHGRASQVKLSLRQTESTVCLQVSDNGQGFDADASFPGHLGLQSMRERASFVHGKLVVDSQPGRGTVVRIEVPRQVSAAEENGSVA